MPPFHLLVFISKLDFPFVENGAKNISFSNISYAFTWGKVVENKSKI